MARAVALVGRAFAQLLKVIFLILKPFLYLWLFVIALTILAFWVAAIIGILFGLPYGQFFVGNLPWLSALLYFQTFLSISIPLLSIGFAVWSLLRTRRPGVVKLKKRLWGIWTVNLILLVSIASFFARDFASGGYVKNNSILQPPGEIMELNFEKYEAVDPLFKIDAGEFLLANGKLVNKNIDTEFKLSEGDFTLNQINYARAQTTEEAEALASKINFSIEQEGSQINIPRYFFLNAGEKWRNQKVRLVLEIPLGQKVKVAKNQRYNINMASYSKCDAKDGFYFLEMTKNGLECYTPE